MGAVIASVMVIAIVSLVYFHYQDKKGSAESEISLTNVRIYQIASRGRVCLP